MAISIFNDMNDVKEVVGGAVNASMYIDSLAPYFDLAHQQHLEDWMGTDLYNSLVAAVAANSFTSVQTALIPYYRRSLAWLALLEYHPHASTQWSEAGLMRVENENMKTAYKYQESAKLASTRSNGYEALEKLILYCEANKATITAWPTAPGYLRHHGVLLHTAATFRIAQSKKISRHVFDLVRGTIEDVEAFAVVPLIGEDQYLALLEARRTNTWTSETLEKKAIYLLQRAIAHFTLDNAMRLAQVQFDGESVVQREFLEDQGVPKQGVAAMNATGNRIALHDETANRHLKQAKAFLDTNVEDAAFADYKAHLATLAEAEAAYQAEREAAKAAQAVPVGTERTELGAPFSLWGAEIPRTGVGRI